MCVPLFIPLSLSLSGATRTLNPEVLVIAPLTKGLKYTILMAEGPRSRFRYSIWDLIPPYSGIWTLWGYVIRGWDAMYGMVLETSFHNVTVTGPSQNEK